MNKEHEKTKADPAPLPVDGHKWDLAGPNVEDDIRRAINRYGADSVRNAANKLAKRKPGRPTENDWPELIDVHKSDAREWLEGGDPLATRSNYSIAKEFADRDHGQSHPSTLRRIERKLKRKPYDRLFRMFFFAVAISEENYPHGTYIHALEELEKIGTHPVWGDILERAKSDIFDYEVITGKHPPENFSMKQVRDAPSNVVKEFLQPHLNASAGLFAPYNRNHEGKG